MHVLPIVALRVENSDWNDRCRSNVNQTKGTHRVGRCDTHRSLQQESIDHRALSLGLQSKEENSQVDKNVIAFGIFEKTRLTVNFCAKMWCWQGCVQPQLSLHKECKSVGKKFDSLCERIAVIAIKPVWTADDDRRQQRRQQNWPKKLNRRSEEPGHTNTRVERVAELNGSTVSRGYALVGIFCLFTNG